PDPHSQKRFFLVPSRACTTDDRRLAHPEGRKLQSADIRTRAVSSWSSLIFGDFVSRGSSEAGSWLPIFACTGTAWWWCIVALEIGLIAKKVSMGMGRVQPVSG